MLSRPPETATARHGAHSKGPRQFIECSNSAAAIGARSLFDPVQSDYVDAHVYRRADIGLGATIPGPAALTEDQTTTIVPSGFSASVNELGHLVLTRAS